MAQFFATHFVLVPRACPQPPSCGRMSRRRRRARRDRESYLSKDPAKRAAQLGNLGLTSAEPGNRRAVTHGAYARVAAERLDAKVFEVFDALAEDAPLRDRDGALPAADTVAVRMLAEALCRLEDVSG